MEMQKAPPLLRACHSVCVFVHLFVHSSTLTASRSQVLFEPLTFSLAFLVTCSGEHKPRIPP